MTSKNKQIGEIVRVPITDIVENPINYQIYSSKHTKEDEELEQSITLYGQLEPVLVNKENNQLAKELIIIIKSNHHLIC